MRFDSPELDAPMHISSAANEIFQSVNDTIRNEKIDRSLTEFDHVTMFLTPFLVIFIATLAFLTYTRRNYGKTARPLLPPGPVGIPILGYLPFLDILDLGGSFSKLSRKYGDVFSLKVGTETAVVLSSYDAIKSVLSDSRFDSRPNTLMFKVRKLTI